MEFDMPECGGCKTCEMMCSFHHEGNFSFAGSSIKIIDKGSEKGYIVRLEEDNENHNACDGCLNEDIPLCMKYCEQKEILEGFIKEYLSKTGKNNECK